MMLRSVRHRDLTPRVEMMPLIDVVFLLLTFFIYSFVMMVRAEVLPVALTSLGTGGRPNATQLQAITVDHAGKLFLNREPINEKDLRHKLQEMAQLEKPPTVYVALEAEGSSDRGPVLINLIEQVRAAGIEDFAIVGQPKP